MKTFLQKLPIFLSLASVVFLFFLFSPTKNASLAVYYDCSSATKQYITETQCDNSGCNESGYYACHQVDIKDYRCCKLCSKQPGSKAPSQCDGACYRRDYAYNCNGSIYVTQNSVYDSSCCPTTTTTTTTGGNCGINIYTNDTCSGACVGTSKPDCIKQGTAGSYYKCCPTTTTTTTTGGGGSCTTKYPSGRCQEDNLPCTGGYESNLCPGGTTNRCCKSGWGTTTYDCPNPSRCSNTRNNCRPYWKSTDPNCGDTQNAQYEYDATCTCTSESCTGTPCTQDETCGSVTYDTADCQFACIPTGQSTCKPNGTAGNYHCCSSNYGTSVSCDRCSDDYKYMKTKWESTEGCNDTTNAKYYVDCNCAGGNEPKNSSDDYADTNCKDEARCYDHLYLASGETKDGQLAKVVACNGKLDCTDYSDDYLTKNCTTCDSGNDTDGKCRDNGKKACTKTIYHKGKTDETTDCKQVTDYTIACHDDNCTSNQTCNQTTGNCDDNTGATATLTPTRIPGSTSTPTPIPGTTSTPTPAPTSTSLTFVLGLDGIGTTGDEPNPQDVNCTTAQIAQGCGSNQNPLRTDRTLAVEIFDSNSSSVAQKSGTINYDSSDGLFKGTVGLGAFTTGTYTVKVKSAGYLRRLTSSSQAITSGQINDTPQVRLVTGNVNQDNYINIADYNIFLSCSMFSSDNSTACNTQSDYRALSDLDDNGPINNYDYNLFMRELTVGQGD
jgi:hypothetical protein